MGNSKVFYTSAPASFDYPSVTESKVVAIDSRNREIRQVHIEPDRYKIQVARYQSGAIYVNADPEEYAKLVGHKLVTEI